ncbi:MAG: threonine--tRNA ligase [Gammaproteobacteria bacterium]|nr:MAG: threonine--tRNA ligase [Gammaproteobacteria bacterium]
MSITITLPDGSQRQYDNPVTGLDVANDIGPGLARNAVAMVLNDQQADLTLTIDANATVQFITRDKEAALEILRHDCAHLMAQAVKELYPETQVTIGPSIENGFYYDFFREESFTPDDLLAIEKRMQELVDRDDEIIREVWERDEAIGFFEAQGETFKAELIRDLPADETISVYKQGEFIDLCRGPHLPSVGKLGKSFKIMKLAGAYWRGDSNKPQLQRVYGTCWRDKKELKKYLNMLEEAEKRDHRKLAKEMDLFHQQEEAVGSMFWHPKGWRVRKTLEDYIRAKMERDGYQEVATPQLMDRQLWEKSGHWDKYSDDMFTICTHDHRDMAIKPMNCPGHVQIFNQGLKSYRDLPLRIGEFTTLFRNEAHGALHGLMRARSFSQDDAHIFCTEDQINSETANFIKLLREVYSDFGFTDISIKFSDRPDNRAGSDETWDRAEGALQAAVESLGLECELNPGEGAFYGPKLEFVLKDAIGRDWQCGTLQVDFVLPERLNAEYVGEDSARHRPVMLHRAVLGSLERFMGILIESTAGHLPLWLTPTPVVIATITDDAREWAEAVAGKLKAAGVHAELDLRNEKIGYKVREHSKAKIPQIWVVGKNEAESQEVAVRTLGSKANVVKGIDEAITDISAACKIPV